MLRLGIWARKCPSRINIPQFLSPCWTNIPDDRCQTNLAFSNPSQRILTLNKLPLSYAVTTRDLSTSQILFKDSTFGRLKQMIKDYWYVIIPVEVVTSVFWYGAIFLSLKGGVDIVQVLTNMGVSEQTLSKLPVAGGDAGYHGLSFICYKVISPVRHGLSLAISAAIVKRLETTRPGYLKTSSEIAKEAKETKDDLKEKYDEKVAESKEKYDEMKTRASEKRDDFMEKYDERMFEGREKYDEMKNKAVEKRDEMKARAIEKKDDLKDKYEDWKKER